jgi:hypothetical protein
MKLRVFYLWERIGYLIVIVQLYLACSGLFFVLFQTTWPFFGQQELA